MAKGNRDIILMQCGTCKRRNYATTKNRRAAGGKLEMKKFCPFCRQHTPHKEAKT